MATWEELSRDSLLAAQELFRRLRCRSSVSRAYYAAYSAVTAALTKRGIPQRYDRENPPHEAVPRMIRKNLGDLDKERRRKLSQSISVLLKLRIDADYYPGHTIDESVARHGVRMAYSVLNILGVDR
ncbi:MAG: HEPN domain-containing protein [Candidatus Sumerlaeota bacterium]|nr:HEPN domain-containing protein [Candidatus Sumerlaeota bacterium]